MLELTSMKENLRPQSLIKDALFCGRRRLVTNLLQRFVGSVPSEKHVKVSVEFIYTLYGKLSKTRVT
jgi:hypothetical protein